MCSKSSFFLDTTVDSQYPSIDVSIIAVVGKAYKLTFLSYDWRASLIEFLKEEHLSHDVKIGFLTVVLRAKQAQEAQKELNTKYFLGLIFLPSLKGVEHETTGCYAGQVSL